MRLCDSYTSDGKENVWCQLPEEHKQDSMVEHRKGFLVWYDDYSWGSRRDYDGEGNVI